MPDPTPASGKDELRNADKLDFRSWFQRVWWEAYHAGGVDAKRFTSSSHLLDKALPEFETLLAIANHQARLQAASDIFNLAHEYAQEDKTMLGAEKLRAYHYFNAIHKIGEFDDR